MKDKSLNCYLGQISKYRAECMGFAFLFVLGVHSLDVGVTYSGWAKVLIKVFSYGQVGVNIFFILSGLGMYYSLRNKKGLTAFYVRRVKTIVPSYLLIAIPAFFIVDCALDKLSAAVFFQDVFFIRYWLKGVGYWYVAIQIILYLLIPFHNIICYRMGRLRWIMNLSTIILSLLASQLLYIYTSKQMGLLLERYAVFIAGYWIAEYVEKNRKVPLLIVFMLIVSMWFRRFLPSYLQDVAINVSYSITGFGLCCLLSFCLDRIKLLSKPLKIIGAVTLEFYMLNVSFNWILMRMNISNYTLFPVVYWLFNGIVAFVIAVAIHKISDYIVSRI